MATKRCISKLSLSLPYHLTSIDWNNAHYRTSVASCLVQGVYSLAIDSESEARPWWQMFNFTLLQTLIEESDNSVYAAVFEYNFFDRYNNFHHIPGVRPPPRFVIAFRGTILKSKTWFCDAKLDLRCMFDNLQHGKRFIHAMQVIKAMVSQHGDTSIWLSGHSLGAGLALLAGKSMAWSGFFLETYIFNPPISSLPLEQILGRTKILKGGIRVVGSIYKAGVARIFKGPDEVREKDEDGPMNIASWTPWLHVNSEDPICSEYIGYFNNKSFMCKMGLSEIERIANKISVRSFLVGIGGRASSSSSDFITEPLHLLPSAYMTVNSQCKRRFPLTTKRIRKAHGLHQWWDPSFSGEYFLYKFNT